MGETVDLPDRDMWESDEMQETLVDQAHRNKAIVTRLFEEVAYPPRPDIDVLDEIIAPHARHADRHLPRPGWPVSRALGRAPSQPRNAAAPRVLTEGTAPAG